MFRLIIVLLYLSLSLFSQELVTYTNYEKALNIAKKENKNLLMFVYTDDCPWCSKMKKQTLSHEKTIEFINNNFIFLTINKNSSVYPKEFIPRFIPTTYLIDAKNEEELYALYGFKTSDALILELDGFDEIDELEK
ncbi:MAG: thioredoxin family protein [Arcobacteraceae bacterium]